MRHGLFFGEEDGATQVAAIDPLAPMAAVNNAEVKKAAAQVGARLKAVVDGL